VLESYVGKYAAFGEVFEVFQNGDRLKGSIQGMVFNLVPLNETTFQPAHWLADLGFTDLLGISFDLNNMEIKFLAGNEKNPDLMIINFGDIFYEICPRYPQIGEIPLLWDDLTGEYDLVARPPSGEVGSDVLGKTSIQVEDGVLQMAGMVGPILPISDTEIVILSGPFSGETMVYEPSSGNIAHQSIVYEKH